MVPRIPIGAVAAFCLASAVTHAGGGTASPQGLCAFGQQFKIILYSCLSDETAKAQFLRFSSWEASTRASAEYHVRTANETWWVDDLQNLKERGTLKQIGLAANSTKAEKAAGRETALRLFGCIQAADFTVPFDSEGDETYETLVTIGPTALHLAARLKIPPMDLVNAMRAAERRLLPDLAAFRAGQGDVIALTPVVWRAFGESCTEGDGITAKQILAYLAHDLLKITD